MGLVDVLALTNEGFIYVSSSQCTVFSKGMHIDISRKENFEGEDENLFRLVLDGELYPLLVLFAFNFDGGN